MTLKIKPRLSRIFREKFKQSCPDYSIRGDRVMRSGWRAYLRDKSDVTIATVGITYGKSDVPKHAHLNVYTENGMDLVKKFLEDNPGWTIDVDDCRR